MREFVRTERDGAIATIRLDRPPGPARAKDIHLHRAVRAAAEARETGLATGLEIERLYFPGLFATEDPARGNAQFHREWAGEGHLHRR